MRIHTVACDQLSQHLKDHEVCIVLSSAEKKPSAFIKGLIDKASPLMTTEQDYLKIHVGFYDERKAYLVAEWAKAGNNALERRWLLNKMRDRAKLAFDSKMLAIYLDETCGSSEIIMAEDFYFAQTDALTLKSSYESFRLLADPKVDVAALDPHRELRYKHHHDYRLWINENPDELTSIEIGARLQAFAAKHKCSFEAFDVDRLQALGMNLLLAVGQASQRSPSRLFILTHNMTKGGDAPLLLVGKGITFDTGGINVKPFEGFVNCMKNDMGGASLMSHLFMALVASGYNKPIVLAIPACENLVDANAMKPGVIVRSYAGKSVVIEHTDAEGRLILADAIAYAGDTYKPKLTVCAATLTTAVLRQFSNYFTAVHFASEDIQRELHASAAKWGEAYTCWSEFLPFHQGNKTLQADLTNMGRMPHHASIGGGSNVAGHFLKEFARSPFIHLDIFATTWNWSGDYPGCKYGATGAPFNSLFHAFRERIGQLL